MATTKQIAWRKKFVAMVRAHKFKRKGRKGRDAARTRKGTGVRQKNPSGVRIVHNKLLGGWFIVRGPHQTPLGGRFNSKAEAQAHLQRKKNPVVGSGPAEKYFTPAKRGDLFLIELTSSYTSLHGGSHRQTRHEFRRVSNVSKDGRVTGVLRRSATGNEFHDKPRVNVYHVGLLVPALRLTDATKAFNTVSAEEYENLDAARAAIKPFIK